jgi:hypothetical protein
MTERFFGLDGEMSGAEIEDGHRLIQIGVAVDTAADGTSLERPELFCSLIGWDDEDLPWSERAAKVHNIPREKILTAPRADVVDAALHDWLVARGASAEARRKQVMVGLNVGVFDGPFVRQALPRTFALFTRRYGDLNPLIFALGSTVRISGGTPSANAWKRGLKDAGRKVVADFGRLEAEHDAGTDALIALGGWRFIEATLAGLDADATRQRKSDRERRKQATRPI